VFFLDWPLILSSLEHLSVYVWNLYEKLNQFSQTVSQRPFACWNEWNLAWRVNFFHACNWHLSDEERLAWMLFCEILMFTAVFKFVRNAKSCWFCAFTNCKKLILIQSSNCYNILFIFFIFSVFIFKVFLFQFV